eukprot:TRINITY_DN5975_c0_g1_i1.p1 TRINITY_DN5975_c0_g1~~TRINITY_DN5975_c0_g1_i1.p1  ORF type:complete len:1499 (+),score=431.09 TRINITY_DN5975_c0_g1_i1:1236-5732(+)
MMTEVLEIGLIDALLEWSKQMGKSELAQHLNRSDLGMQKRLFGVPKLEDANLAGTKEGHNCTLILTEGDSAKALAVAGLSVIGRDRYGVFPLRGKLRNVRELTVKQMLENKEIDQVLKIMALDATKEYQDAKGLRYGSIMIMTDQDHDGSHIKGLIINFIQHWFPSLLRVPGFLKEFVTPIVKMTKGDEVKTFFTLPEYMAWKEENNDGQGWKCKYYKGLGTSTSSEAKDYFADIQDHEIHFSYSGARDDDLIDMAFAAKRSDDRKTWISQVEEGTFVDHAQSTLTYSDFIEKELVLFAQYDVQRAVPCMVDGLKPGQRKVLYGAFKKKLNQEIKVAQLSGYVAENSAYHHGEVSLQGTIIAMAQNFVGTNNINLFEPRGQFGSRLQGGKDHAAARYIFTRLSQVTRCLFPDEDDPVLQYQSEEGHQIEPYYYSPIIPLVLVNGADGIGTGWSTSIPNFNPRDIIANIRRLLRKEDMEPMTPWFRGFKGSVRPIEGSPGKFEAIGVAQRKGRVRLEITELPVRRWTQDYKDWLVDQLPKSGAEKRAMITELREYHSENSVHFVLSMTPDKLSEAERRGFEKTFHLRSSLSTSNMWLFDAEGKIRKYESPEDIIAAFLPVRMDIYEKRKAYMIAKMEKELAVLSNKLRFVELVISDRLNVEKRKTKELCAEMRKAGLVHMCQITGKGEVKLGSEEEAGADGFKYLLSMKMWSLTENKVESLRKQHAERSAALEELKSTTLEELWERDLQRLEKALDACDEEDRKEAEAAAKLAAKNMGEENILVNKQCVLVLSQDFRAKRVRTSEWKARRRGAALSGKRTLCSKAAKKGKKEEEDGAGDADEGEAEEAEEAEEATGGSDALAGVFCCHDFDALLVFSEHGFVYMLQALDVPLAKKMSAPGTELKDFLPELDGHRIAAMVTVSQGSLRDQSNDFVVLVSKNGMAKKVSLDRYRGLKPGKGVPAMKLDNGDELRWAHKASANSALVCASRDGLVLRVSLGEDWRLSSAKGPGKCVMRTSHGDGIASCSVSDLTPAEQAKIRAKAAAKAAKVAAANSANGAGTIEAAAKGQDEESDKDDAENAAEESEVEDDKEDIDEGDDAAAELPKAGSETQTGGGAEQGADSTSVKADCEADTESAKPSASDVGQCVLVVSENGMGLRTPLSCKRISLGRRGGKGRKVIKLTGKDNLVAACVVSGQGEAQQPTAPLRAWQLYVKDHPEAAEAIAVPSSGAGELEANTEDSSPQGTAAAGFAKVHALQAKFSSLHEDEQRPYLERAEEMKLQYEEELEAYRRQDIEEVLLGSTNGAVTRITVGSVPITVKVNRGRTIAKTKNSDRLCVASLLSSMDDDPEEQAANADKQGATTAPKPTIRKLVSNRLAALRRRAGTQAGQQDQTGQQEPGEAAPSTPKLDAPAESPRRGQQKASLVSLRARLSHLATSPRLTPSRLRLQGNAGGFVMQKLKPKLRLVKNPFNPDSSNSKIVVLKLDLKSLSKSAALRSKR